MMTAKVIGGVAAIFSAMWWTMAALVNTSWARRQFEISDWGVLQLQAKFNALAAGAAAVAAIVAFWT
ncbi:hypothetical protein AFCDBAGC_4681 [Methylobacterium cerastii]|uniref:Integral membrane protein n=1 Tax=Methylobacterium cerastii TaxID=932741 RepID=A0ABQ4QNF9_9HYPH|nr:hypothetical protein [Methylobacterium cerastii]GJD46797.1 hypothetical protein AFCDBAGC_4681 [Methylobacterium cerastii]